MEAAMELLAGFETRGDAAGLAFTRARGVDLKGQDNDLCILFLATWAKAAYLRASTDLASPDEAWALLHRARALLSDQTPAEIIATSDIVEAHLLALEGNISKQETTLREILKRLPPDSPRRSYAVLELALCLAHAGRCRDISPELQRVRSMPHEHFQHAWLDLAAFVDAVEAGDSSRARDLQRSLSPHAADPFIAPRLSRYTLLLRMETQNLAERPDLPNWALVLQCLLSGSLHQALRWARLCEKQRPASITGTGLTSYNLIRAELAEGNSEAARRLLDLRRARGNQHYLDDFFLARCLLLSGRRDEAGDRFAGALKAADTYAAQARLEFEMRLAADLPRDAVLRITRRCETIQSKPRLAPGDAPPLALPTPDTPSLGINRIVGTSDAIRTVRDTILRFADSDVPVLITGETGTGKELVARAIHEAGPRSEQPFLAVNCAAISDSLLESELFGHEKGAFTGAASAHQGLFEDAASGTLLLDEIGDISPRLQTALLRVLETGEFRRVGSTQARTIACRILASTNADLDRRAREASFRRDILFRLRRLEVHIPPLHERRDDILPLATHFLNLGRESDAPAMLSARLCDRLRTYPWPGNVPELRNAIERMRLMNSDKQYYDVEDIDLHAAPGSVPAAALPPGVPLPVGAVPTVATAIPLPVATATTPLREGRSPVRRLQHLRRLFAEHEILTRAEIIRTLDISPNTATKDLKVLCEEGCVRRIQPSASPRSAYFAWTGETTATGDTGSGEATDRVFT
jgi:DNA-binding NtrC family response regulator